MKDGADGVVEGMTRKSRGPNSIVNGAASRTNRNCQNSTRTTHSRQIGTPSGHVPTKRHAGHYHPCSAGRSHKHTTTTPRNHRSAASDRRYTNRRHHGAVAKHRTIEQQNTVFYQGPKPYSGVTNSLIRPEYAAVLETSSRSNTNSAVTANVYHHSDSGSSLYHHHHHQSSRSTVSPFYDYTGVAAATLAYRQVVPSISSTMKHIAKLPSIRSCQHYFHPFNGSTTTHHDANHSRAYTPMYTPHYIRAAAAAADYHDNNKQQEQQLSPFSPKYTPLTCSTTSKNYYPPTQSSQDNTTMPPITVSQKYTPSKTMPQLHQSSRSIISGDAVLAHEQKSAASTIDFIQTTRQELRATMVLHTQKQDIKDAVMDTIAQQIECSNTAAASVP